MAPNFHLKISKMTEQITKLAELFSRFPGVGQKQAKRFVYFLLGQNPVFTKKLIQEIDLLKKSASACHECFRFFFNPNDKNLCSICSDGKREKILMIVSRDLDIENIEKAGEFKGRYFVLGGSLPILEKEPAKKIRIGELLNYLEKLGHGKHVGEIILATDFNPEGENTAEFVKKQIEPLSKKFGFKISSLGKGLSLGTELEYSDPETIKNALKNRH